MPNNDDALQRWEQTFDADTLERQSVTATFLPGFDDERTQPSAPHAPERGFTLGAVIGRGGLADVFEAEQGTLRREVAVKRIRETGRTRLLRAFTHEARLTAGLNHPNILPIHDLITLDGTPALVMKRVRGQAWEAHLRERRQVRAFDLVSEVRRLTDVCEAIAFAHSRGVLHLDLKPANVMVGDFGETLVMDWGCAALFNDQDWETQPDLPRTDSLIRPFGTPAFMSPEQALGDGTAFGPHTDVYLLGAILYDLLAGQPLRSGHTVRSMVEAAAVGERQPLPDDVPAPLAALCLHATAARPDARLDSVRALQHGLLDWLDTRESRLLTQRALTVVAELEKARPLTAEQRQEGNQLLGVLEQAGRRGIGLQPAIEGEWRLRTLLADAALTAGEPGLARAMAQPMPDTAKAPLLDRAHALAKEQARTALAARRLRWTLTGAGLLLLGALATVTLQWQQVTRERDRSDAVRQFSSDMLAAVDPDVAQGLDNTLMLKVLEQGQAKAETSYASQPEVLAEVLATIGQTYLTLGRYEDAEQRLQQAVDISATSLGPTHAKTLKTKDSLADALRFQGRLEEAKALRERLVAEHVQRWGETHEATLAVRRRLATLVRETGDSEQAERTLTDVLELQRAHLGPQHQEALATMVELASCLTERGELVDAERLLLTAYQASDATLGPSHHTTLTRGNNLALLYDKQGRASEAESLYKEVLSRRQQVLGQEHHLTLLTLVNLGNHYVEHRDFERAEPLLVEALALRESSLGPTHPSTLESLNSLQHLYQMQGRVDEAAPLLERAFAGTSSLLGPDHPKTLNLQGNLAVLLVGQGKQEQAGLMFEQVLSSQRTVLGDDHPKTLGTQVNLAALRTQLGQLADAESLYLDSLQKQRERFGLDHPVTFEFEGYLGSFYARQEQYERALPHLNAAFSGYQGRDATSRPALNLGWATAMTLQKLGRTEEAERLRVSVLETATSALGDNPPSTVQAQWLERLAVPIE